MIPAIDFGNFSAPPEVQLVPRRVGSGPRQRTRQSDAPALAYREAAYALAESARFQADTVNVGPGQRYDVVWKALKPGKWLIHCHIPHHTTNNNVEHKGGGLTMILDVYAECAARFSFNRIV